MCLGPGKTAVIVVTGGVCSSIGKGVLVSALGVLAQEHMTSFTVLKLDPYLNVDPGTMSPLEHGEVFVTHDGAETDLDLGHYERMLGVELTKESSVSAGQIFQELLERERSGQLLGSCIQLVPHAVDAIKRRIRGLMGNTDLLLVEVGGTVGDMEGEIFLEALRQLRLELEPRQLLHCHLSYVPYLASAREVKTKPTQHSVMMLKKSGIVPDVLFLRTEQDMPEAALRKVAVMCGVSEQLVFQVKTYTPLYELFLNLRDQQIPAKLCDWFKTPLQGTTLLHQWEALIQVIKAEKPTVSIGMVVKYRGSSEPYMSIIEALKAAGYAQGYTVNIKEIDAHILENSRHPEYETMLRRFDEVDGILVPGGFGAKGVEGKIRAAELARTRGIPYLGICLGMQVVLIEAARNVLGLVDAHTAEIDPETAHPVVMLMDEQQQQVDKGGTMRLGGYPCHLKPGTRAHQAYGTDIIVERHRHRYEGNPLYRERWEQAGLVVSGVHPQRNLIEVVEHRDHPFMVGVQFHPEFTSRPLQPHPLFKAFVQHAVSYKDQRVQHDEMFSVSKTSEHLSL